MAVSAFSWDGITVGFQLPTAEKDLNPKTPTLLWTSNLDYYVIIHEKPFFCHQLRQLRRAHRMCRILEEISLWWHGLLFAFQMALGKRPCTQAIGSARKGLLEMPRAQLKVSGREWTQNLRCLCHYQHLIMSLGFPVFSLELRLLNSRAVMQEAPKWLAHYTHRSIGTPLLRQNSKRSCI